MTVDTGLKTAFLTARRGALNDSDAAAHVGVSRRTILRWRDADDDFDAQLTQLKAEIAVLNSAIVRRAASDDWRAAFTLAQAASAERELERLRELTTDRDARP